MSKFDSRVSRGQRINRIEEIFSMRDKEIDFSSIAEEMVRRDTVGKKSEEDFDKALGGKPGIKNVCPASRHRNDCAAVDRVVKTEAPLYQGRWEVQIKSNSWDCEKFESSKRKEYRVKTIEEVKERMAKNGKMVINAAAFRNDQEKNQEHILEQFHQWLDLSKTVRSKSNLGH